MTNDMDQFLPSMIRLAKNDPLFGFVPIAVIAAVVAIVILTKTDFWKDFAERRKWRSRIVLAILMVFVAGPLCYMCEAIFAFLPGKIRLESPNLTATAIKLGLLGLYLDHEYAERLPSGKKAAAACISAISRQQAMEWQAQCGDDRACSENIPAMTRQDIMVKIKELQAEKSSALKTVVDACKGVGGLGE